MKKSQAMKEKIINYFFETLLIKSIDQISIKEITTELKISRMTFYYYFANKQDILDEAIEELLQGFSLKLKENTHFLEKVNMNSELSITEALHDNALELVNYFYENKKALSALISENSNTDFLSLLLATYYNHFLLAVSPIFQKFYSQKVLGLYINYMTSGVIAICEEWFFDNFDSQPEIVTDRILEMLAPSLANLYIRGKNKNHQA